MYRRLDLILELAMVLDEGGPGDVLVQVEQGLGGVADLLDLVLLGLHLGPDLIEVVLVLVDIPDELPDGPVADPVFAHGVIVGLEFDHDVKDDAGFLQVAQFVELPLLKDAGSPIFILG